MEILGFILLALLVLIGGLLIMYFIGLLAIFHAIKYFFDEWEEIWGKK